MSRSGYSSDGDGWGLIRWRGQVASAIRGKRGQRLLLDLVRALDAMPVKRLIKNELVCDGEVCALGAVGVKRGLDMGGLDPEDAETVAARFDIATPLAQEVVYINDDEDGWRDYTPEERWKRVRTWAVACLQPVDLVDIPDNPPPNTGET